MDVVNKLPNIWFDEILSVRVNISFFHSSTEKKFRRINSFVILLVKTLLSRFLSALASWDHYFSDFPICKIIRVITDVEWNTFVSSIFKGWTYAVDFPAEYHPKKGFTSCVRRRKWIRYRKYVALDTWSAVPGIGKDATEVSLKFSNNYYCTTKVPNCLNRSPLLIWLLEATNYPMEIQTKPLFGQ